MQDKAAAIFNEEWANAVFPPERTDDFFEALFGGAEEGAYDISLRFVQNTGKSYEFSFDLRQRPGKCLACNLTYGLPQVFARHPILNVKEVARRIGETAGADPAEVAWELKPTREVSSSLHCIPLIVTLNG